MGQLEVITISKFKATCLAVLDNVKRTGRPVLVTRHGKPVAVIDPPPPPKAMNSWLGSFKTRGKITGDIIAPALPEEAWHVINE
ncbi:MAG: type II toxin-antitoxin system Phd/YefM family antitoxin [Pseudomonadota bacterium]